MSQIIDSHDASLSVGYYVEGLAIDHRSSTKAKALSVWQGRRDTIHGCLFRERIYAREADGVYSTVF